MKYEIIIRPEAEQDLLEAFEWYESRRKGLGHDFLLQVEAGFKLIARNPNVSSEIYYNVRRYLVKRFPYKIFFLMKESQILILAVIHSRRNPAWINKRLN